MLQSEVHFTSPLMRMEAPGGLVLTATLRLLPVVAVSLALRAFWMV
jgi:hypothetical protein